MSDSAEQHGSATDERRCPECGTLLATATTDPAETPDVTEGTDLPRTEFDPGSMVATAFCPDPDCPRHGTAPDGASGAVL